MNKIFGRVIKTLFLCLLIVIIQLFPRTPALRPATADVPTLNAPIFEFLDEGIAQVKGGANIRLTFKNSGHPATMGTVWIPWERVIYAVSLGGSPPRGNISEAIVGLDVNGDGDALDLFNICYVNETQVKVDSSVANSMWIPAQTLKINRTTLYVQEKNSFTLGSKIHALYTADTTYALFALDTFFRGHLSPNVEVIIYQYGASKNITPSAEIIGFKINGKAVPYDFNWVLNELQFGEWWVDNVYIYPIGFLSNGDIFTIELSIRGAPGSYWLKVVFNWASDTLHRYRYDLTDTVAIPFNITSEILNIQPPWFNFGKVYVNSKIDASCKILHGEIVGLKSVPEWLEVSHVGSDWLSFSVNTSLEGCYFELLIIKTTVGEAEVEISYIVRSTPSPRLKMLIFDTPFDMYSTSYPEEWKTFTDIMDVGLVNVSYVGYHRGYYGAFPSNIEDYDVLLVDGGGLCSLVSSEIDNLKDYVKNGGNLIICADAFYVGSVEKANQICNDFGLSVRDEEYGYEVFVKEFTPHPITKGVTQLRVLRPSPVKALTTGTTALARPHGVSENEGILAISEQSGKIVMLGNSLWWYSFLYYGWSYDNPQIFLNIIGYMIGNFRNSLQIEDPSVPKLAFMISIESTGGFASNQWNFRTVLWDITKRAPDVISFFSEFPGVDLFVAAWDIIVSDKNGDGHLDANEVLDELASQLKDKLTRKIIEQSLSRYLWPLSPEAVEHASEIFIVGLSGVIGTLVATETMQSVASIGFFTGTYSFGIPIIGYKELSGLWKMFPFGGFSGSQQLEVSALSPVDVTISDTFGRVVNKTICEIPGANYREFDANRDGDVDIIITLPSMNMKYNLTVTPKPDANPNDSYSIIVENNYISFQVVNSTVAELSQSGCNFILYTYDLSTYEALEIGFPIQDPLEKIEPYQNVTITVSAISRISQIVNVTLYFSLNNGNTWMPIKMTEITTNIYHAIILGQQNDTWISYYFVAYDNTGNFTIRDNNGYYYQFYVVPEFPSIVMWLLLMLATLTSIVLAQKREKTNSHS